MWKIIFITLVLFYGVAGKYGGSDRCYKDPSKVCNLPDVFDSKTKVEWRRTCPRLREAFACLRDYFDECRYNEFMTEQTLREIWRIWKGNCREESGSFGEFLAARNELCQFRAERYCRIYFLLPDDVPFIPRELWEVCSDFDRGKQCIADAVIKCKSNITKNEVNDSEKEVSIGDRQILKEQRKLIDASTEICDRNSSLYQNLVPHLRCLSSTLNTQDENQTCRDYSSNAVEILENRIERLARMAGENDDKIREVRYGLTHCLRTIFDINCIITLLITSCDSSLKQPILEVIEKGVSLESHCSASSRLDVIEMLDALKLVTQQEIYIKKLIRVNSFF